MRRTRTILGRKDERGVVILLVAVVLLFVVGAMAVLAIDLTTFYTARSEAQLAADAGALAGARALANSGMTSLSPPNAAVTSSAVAMATQIAQQVAMQSDVGGRTLNTFEVKVSFPNSGSPLAFATNPQVTVSISRTDLPTFFARIWGSTTVAVSASATAEAYNPSGAAAAARPIIPIAAACVKPWLLPNIDPSATGTNPIFNSTNGAILTSTLLNAPLPGIFLQPACTTCPPSPLVLQPWQYYPGDPTTSFPPPSAASVACPGSSGFTPYQLSIAGCVQPPIACNSTVNIDTASYPTRNAETADAVDCLARTEIPNNQGGDLVDAAVSPPPFQFLAGANNPVVQAGKIAAGTPILVSNSLVTVPVFDSGSWTGGTSVQIIGFVQLFLQPNGDKTAGGHVNTTVTNIVGCGTTATGPPIILGNGPSAVPVRLVTPP